MIKPINGTWFEFQHPHLAEGKYWNPVCRSFSAEQWKEKVREIASLGMKYIVLGCASIVYEEYAESYFDSGIYPQPEDFGCDDPMGAMLMAADECGNDVFISVGIYGVWTRPHINMTNPEVTKRAFQAMTAFCEKYSHHKSFYGWYYPDETCVAPYFDEQFIDYVNRYSAFAKTLVKGKKTLIAPYGTCLLKADDKYVTQLTGLDVDFIAYQDEVGVRKATPDQTGIYYEALRKAHDRADRAKLWADVELFDFEGDVYKSALIPAKIERIKKQLESVSPYVDEVLAYQYIGMMNKPGTTAYCGHPDSEMLYGHYEELIKS